MLIIIIVYKNVILSPGYYQNVHGLKTKSSIFRQNFVTLKHYDFFIFTETWLTTEISCSELGIFDFLIYHNDRSNINSIYSKGGEVLVAINNRFSSRILSLPNLTLETQAISITTTDSKITLLASFIPPNSTVEVYTYFPLSVNRKCRFIFSWSYFYNNWRLKLTRNKFVSFITTMFYVGLLLLRLKS